MTYGSSLTADFPKMPCALGQAKCAQNSSNALAPHKNTIRLIAHERSRCYETSISLSCRARPELGMEMWPHEENSLGNEASRGIAVRRMRLPLSSAKVVLARHATELDISATAGQVVEEIQQCPLPRPPPAGPLALPTCHLPRRESEQHQEKASDKRRKDHEDG